MKLRPDDYAPKSAQVQVKKDVHYTVTPIADINAWKAEQQLLEAAYQAKRAEKVANVTQALAEGKDLDFAAVQALEAGLKAEQSQYRQMLEQKPKAGYWLKPGTEEHAAYFGLDSKPQEALEQEPKPTLGQRVKEAISKVWRNAFPS